MNQKIVFFDIDGTLYDYLKGIPESTKEAIKQLRNNNHLAIICTGRTKVMIFDEILELGFDGIIAGAGSYVEYNNNILFEHQMQKENVLEVVRAMRENGFVPLAEGKDNIYFDDEEENKEYVHLHEIYQSKIANYILPISSKEINAAKVSGRFTPKSNWNGIFNKLSDKFTFVNHGNALLEMIPKNFSKATGIKILLEHLHKDTKDTYAFGDSFNDLEMLRYVEYGIAMGNAPVDLKGLVKYHTTSMFDDGIYNGLREFGLI